MVEIQKRCVMCGQTKTIEMPAKAFESWIAGAHIQDVAPELSVDDRELLISGICGNCFDTLFGEDDSCECEAE